MDYASQLIVFILANAQSCGTYRIYHILHTKTITKIDAYSTLKYTIVKETKITSNLMIATKELESLTEIRK